MILKLIIELPDTPGQLMNILQPLSNFGANVSTIIHEHENKTADGKIPVHFTIEASKKVLEKAITFIQEQGLDIVEVDGILQKQTQTFLLLGNMPTSDLMQTVHKIDDIDIIKVSSVDLNIGNNLQDSVCKMVIETKEDNSAEATRLVQEIADNDGLVLIKQI